MGTKKKLVAEDETDWKSWLSVRRRENLLERQKRMSESLKVCGVSIKCVRLVPLGNLTMQNGFKFDEHHLIEGDTRLSSHLMTCYCCSIVTLTK